MEDTTSLDAHIHSMADIRAKILEFVESIEGLEYVEPNWTTCSTRWTLKWKEDVLEVEYLAERIAEKCDYSWLDISLNEKKSTEEKRVWDIKLSKPLDEEDPQSALKVSKHEVFTSPRGTKKDALTVFCVLQGIKVSVFS